MVGASVVPSVGRGVGAGAEVVEHSVQPLHFPQRHLVVHGDVLVSQRPWQVAVVGAGVGADVGGGVGSGAVGAGV